MTDAPAPRVTVLMPADNAGRYVAHPSRLARQIAALDREPALSLVGGFAVTISGDDTFTSMGRAGRFCEHEGLLERQPRSRLDR